MSNVKELAEDLLRQWRELENTLAPIFEAGKVLGIQGMATALSYSRAITEALEKLWDEMTAIHDELRAAAKAWGLKGTAGDVRAAADMMQGSPGGETGPGTGYLGLQGVWTGDSFHAAMKLHRAVSFAMDSDSVELPNEYNDQDCVTVYTGTDDLHIADWGESQRCQFMAELLDDMADEMEIKVLDGINNIAATIGMGVAIGTVAVAAATGVGLVMAVVGLVLGLISFYISAWNSLYGFYQQVSVMTTGSFGGMTSELPNYGPEWAGKPC